ncbi:MAG: (deoxy)nucleoside triphosphate pyrophosphohydrolase [Clostridiales bacterium]|nr:(deoxy)nucleoside triphosphate pyrophosphohydrolase [Clostridiales bacterium]
MKIINVVAAIIVRDGKILATQRGYGEYKDGWEFPGGKIEPGESPEDALVREISEELDACIEAGERLVTVEHDYSDFHLSMQCFFASLKDDSHLKLLEHEASRWLSFDELDDVDWLPADIKVVEALKERGF